MSNTEKIKVCMYLQTNEKKNEKDYNKAMDIIRKSDVDIVVFPEHCYVPGLREMLESAKTFKEVFDFCLEISEDLGKAVVISSRTMNGIIFSEYVNAFATEEETEEAYYFKHTMTNYSALDSDNYQRLVEDWYFDPIIYKGFRIGLSVCYDCNHSLFGRMYALTDGVDLILNSTGGNVVSDKWHKYNKARAIENNCYNLVTMGGDGIANKSKNYVYGFNANGGELVPRLINGTSTERNFPGGLYVYEVSHEAGNAEIDSSNPKETPNTCSGLKFPVGDSDSLIRQAKQIKEGLYKLSKSDENIILCVVHGEDILKPEKVLPLLYAPELKKIPNKRYIIINKHDHVDMKFFREKLSIILRVRSMENYCAVVLESENINKCYQCGKNRTSQVVGAVNNAWAIDLERTTGPEAIWKNKPGMSASWRKNFEWLVFKAEGMTPEE